MLSDQTRNKRRYNASTRPVLFNKPIFISTSNPARSKQSVNAVQDSQHWKQSGIERTSPDFFDYYDPSLYDELAELVRTDQPANCSGLYRLYIDAAHQPTASSGNQPGQVSSLRESAAESASPIRMDPYESLIRSGSFHSDLDWFEEVVLDEGVVLNRDLYDPAGISLQQQSHQSGAEDREEQYQFNGNLHRIGSCCQMRVRSETYHDTNVIQLSNSNNYNNAFKNCREHCWTAIVDCVDTGPTIPSSSSNSRKHLSPESRGASTYNDVASEHVPVSKRVKLLWN
jgi:hypothetical protein